LFYGLLAGFANAFSLAVVQEVFEVFHGKPLSGF
jgi:hypothetical protein